MLIQTPKINAPPPTPTPPAGSAPWIYNYTNGHLNKTHFFRIPGNSSHTSRHPRISCTETHHQSTHKRWLLVYTLLRNPQLIHDRRQGPIEGMSGHPTTSSLLTESSAHYHQLKALVATIEMRAESQRTKASILDPDKREIMIKDTMNGAELQHVPSPTVECPIDGEFTDGQSAITDVSNTDLIEELVSKPTTDISKIVINRILISNRVGDCDSEQPTTTVKENTSFWLVIFSKACAVYFFNFWWN